MRSSARTALPLLLATAALLPSLAVAADTWPVSRHDAGRTGASSAAVPLDAPHVAWRAYVGGRPSAATVRFGAGASEVLVANVGGRFVAKSTLTQAELWSSPLVGDARVDALVDLDGDGTPELVAHSLSRAYVIDTTTGAVRWSSPPAQIEIMGAVRVRDLDGDGLPDLYLDNGIGPKPASSVAVAVSFAGGSAQPIWSQPHQAWLGHVGAGTDALLDLRGDGSTQVVLAGSQSVWLADGASGEVFATVELPNAAGNPYHHVRAAAAELDGSGSRELLLVQVHSHELTQVLPSVSAHSVDLESGTSSLLWHVGPEVYDSELVSRADMVADLDGDGRSEIVYSARVGAEWTTRVLDGASGAVIGELAGARFEGAADLDADGASELVVATPDALRAYSLQAGSLVQRATWGNLRAASFDDTEAQLRGEPSLRLAVLPRVGQRPILIAGRSASAGDPLGDAHSYFEVRGLELGPSGWVSLGSFAPQAGEITGLVRADFATRSYAQVAVGSSDGRVTVLDHAFAPTNGVVWQGQPPAGTLVGGGLLHTAPLAGADEAGPFVVLSGTTFGLKVVDVRDASLVVAPESRWMRQPMHAPLVVEQQGVMQVVGVEGTTLVARRASDGLASASVELSPGRPFLPPIPLRVAGEASPRVGIDWWVDGGSIAQQVVRFDTSSVAWAGAPIPYGGYFGSGAGDTDGDGTDEWYSYYAELRRRSAADGATTSFGSFPGVGYSMPIVAPFAGSSPQLLLQSGGAGPVLASSSGATIWQASTPEALNAAVGARAACPLGTRFVTPASVSPTVLAYDASSGALVAQRVLAQGAAYASRAEALAAGAEPGVLSSVNAVAALGSAGPAVLVGSSDGYVYALDACTLDLRWTWTPGSSMGEPIVSDVDGDGDGEIVVASADGYVYGLDTPLGSAPVVTLSGAAADGSLTLAPGAELSLSWAPVDGAESYELALLDPDQRPLWQPAYTESDGTSASVSLLGALPNRPYFVAVRTRYAEGAGPERIAGPVRIADTTPPTASLSATGGKLAWIELAAADELSLDHYSLVALAPDGGVWPIRDQTLLGTEARRSVAWVPPTELWGSELSLRFDVVDAAGLRSARSLEARIDTQGNMSFGDASTPTDEPPPSNGGDPTPSADSNAPLMSGGGCSTAGHRVARDTWALWALAAALVLVRSRR